MRPSGIPILTAMEQPTGLEPVTPAWQAGVLPLN